MADCVYTVLASGSKGNCSLLRTQEALILIDAGISYKEIESRLKSFGVNVLDIDAVFITHDHSDHMKGCEMLGKNGITTICNSDTARAIAKSTKFRPPFKLFVTGSVFEYKDMRVESFTVQHDTLDPVGFSFSFGSETITFCTDLGIITPYVKEMLLKSTHLILESNHCEDMVHASSRSYVYKQRVLSRQGHLSNKSVFEFLKEIKPHTKQVILAHLSDECNEESVALASAKKALLGKDVIIMCAKQDTPLPLTLI